MQWADMLTRASWSLLVLELALFLELALCVAEAQGSLQCGSTYATYRRTRTSHGRAVPCTIAPQVGGGVAVVPLTLTLTLTLTPNLSLTPNLTLTLTLTLTRWAEAWLWYHGDLVEQCAVGGANRFGTQARQPHAHNGSTHQWGHRHR